MTIDYTQANSGQQWVALLPSAPRTATPNQQQVSAQSSDVDALVLIVDMTAVTATGTVTVTVEGIDPQTNMPYPILISAALGAVARTVLRVHPNLPPVANLTAQDIVPPIFRVTATHGNGVSMTYSITALIPD